MWSDDTDTILRGGSVISNILKGRHMGYGIAAAGLHGWTIRENWDDAEHHGVNSDRCFDSPVNPLPVAFLQRSETITNSVIQPSFIDPDYIYRADTVDQEFQYSAYNTSVGRRRMI